MTAKHMSIVLAAAVSLGVLTSGSALALDDHLKCYKAKEIAGPGKVQYSATLISGVGLNTEFGCLIKGPPKLVCAPVTKTGVSPIPPGGGPTATTTRFFCYKVKCPKGPVQNFGGTDQFGTHVFQLKSPKTLCLPASPSGAFLDDASAF